MNFYWAVVGNSLATLSKYRVVFQLFLPIFSSKMKNDGQPIRVSVPWNSRCTKGPRWLNNVFLFSTEIWAEQLKKPPCTLVAIESSYFSVCQHVRVQISNSSASVFALTAFVRHLPHVRPHMYLKTWCVYAREALVTFVCLLTSMCHLVFLQLMYILVCKSYHIGQTLSNT